MPNRRDYLRELAKSRAGAGNTQDECGTSIVPERKEVPNTITCSNGGLLKGHRHQLIEFPVAQAGTVRKNNYVIDITTV